eukprot:gnl/TRDRNA2_/TRDRNA2_102773_c0_seq1.p1 gnl/TRDRNA2_/TRDRNA2_102773_c0~~gnl/TRDRNA2_/TRDRNA2_102773_c0_seq1.p1  ORF type:complete len:583 (+),score=92.18 gnl/TRDRNA2_/TRDRNA2_102773_c0_seq1:675-2423(+)
MAAVPSHLNRLGPLARSRIAGALLERLASTAPTRSHLERAATVDYSSTTASSDATAADDHSDLGIFNPQPRVSHAQTESNLGSDLGAEAISGHDDAGAETRQPLVAQSLRSTAASTPSYSSTYGSVPSSCLHQASHGAEEQLLVELLCTATGSTLLELKRLIDSAGPSKDLLHLVTEGIVDAGLRAKVLAHFLSEATALLANEGNSCSTDGRLALQRPIHVLSDIDMTVWVSSLRNTGGPKFPQGPVPGAASLFAALGGHVTFLSARPPMFMERTRKLLDDIGISDATVLQGTLATVVRSLFQPDRANQLMGEQKAGSFSQFEALHPEARFVFVGDSGQGDIGFAESFMQSGLRRGLLPRDRRDRAALIHDVTDDSGVRPKTSAARRAELRLGGVHVFDTYAGAAVLLLRLGFLGADGLREAAQACNDEFGAIVPEDYCSYEVFEARRTELLRDLREVNAAMRSAVNDAEIAAAVAAGMRSRSNSKDPPVATSPAASMPDAPTTATAAAATAPAATAEAAASSTASAAAAPESSAIGHEDISVSDVASTSEPPAVAGVEIDNSGSMASASTVIAETPSLSTS